MEALDIFKIVAEELAKLTPYPAAEFRPATRLTDDLGISSLELIELATALEQRFTVTIDDGAFADVTTIGGVVDAMSALVAHGRPA